MVRQSGPAALTRWRAFRPLGEGSHRAMERTFAIIKPDAVSSGHTGAILQRIEEEGFRIVGMRLVTLTKAEAEGFYAVHRERPFFDSLTSFMSAGPYG